MRAKASQSMIGMLVTGLRVYADSNNWKDTDETKEVRNEGIIVGLDVVKAWIGPKAGPEVAQIVLEQIERGN